MIDTKIYYNTIVIKMVKNQWRGQETDQFLTEPDVYTWNFDIGVACKSVGEGKIFQ